MKQLLIIEDDEALANGIMLAFIKEEFLIQAVGTLKEAERLVEQEAFSLILLDINLPDGNGLFFLKKLRSWSDVPVIFLTANDMEYNEVAGLEAGADDYITKPFSLAVLRARVQNILRREEKAIQNGIRFQNKDFFFDFDQIKFYRKGMEFNLSKTEQKVLKILIANRGHIVTRELLFDKVWSDSGEYVDENALSVVVKRLRNKLEENPAKPEYIKTIYGQGYQFEGR